MENKELKDKIHTLEEKTTCAEEKDDNAVASHKAEKNENSIAINEQTESALESSQEHIKRYDQCLLVRYWVIFNFEKPTILDKIYLITSPTCIKDVKMAHFGLRATYIQDNSATKFTKLKIFPKQKAAVQILQLDPLCYVNNNTWTSSGAVEFTI